MEVISVDSVKKGPQNRTLGNTAFCCEWGRVDIIKFHYLLSLLQVRLNPSQCIAPDSIFLHFFIKMAWFMVSNALLTSSSTAVVGVLLSSPNETSPTN